MPNTPDIDVSALAEALNEKMDRGLGNKTATLHYVVETWHSGTEWYRVWSDGFIEQGGFLAPISSDQLNLPVTFLKPFSDTSYTVLSTNLLTSMNQVSGWSSVWFGGGYNKTATGFTRPVAMASNSQGSSWYACGF